MTVHNQEMLETPHSSRGHHISAPITHNSLEEFVTVGVLVKLFFWLQASLFSWEFDSYSCIDISYLLSKLKNKADRKYALCIYSVLVVQNISSKWLDSCKVSHLTFLANSVIAFANGCSLLASAAPTADRNTALEQTELLTNMTARVTIGRPCVSVPVLSKTMFLTCN